ncbi:MAG: PH domain-containing protein [Halioglobus sp.]
MAQTFRSKTDAWLGAVILCAVGFMIATLVQTGQAAEQQSTLATVAMLVLGCGVPLWMLFGTLYTVTPDQLLIKCGPFRWRVPRNEIHEVIPTRSPLSSPALSLDRLQIKYGNGKSVLVSPKHKSDFMEAIGHYNQTSPGE